MRVLYRSGLILLHYELGQHRDSGSIHVNSVIFINNLCCGIQFINLKFCLRRYDTINIKKFSEIITADENGIDFIDYIGECINKKINDQNKK